MRKRGAILVLAPLLAACGSSVAASASPSASSAPATPSVDAARCGPAGALTLAGSPVARVYVARGAAFGCSVGVHKQYRLGGRKICNVGPRLGPVTVAGRLAAYGLEMCGIDVASARVLVTRLTDGKPLLSASAIAHVPGPESFQSVRSIVAKQDGAVAWVAVVSSIVRHGTFIEVHRSDGRGKTVLDSGAAIIPGSLRLHGSRVTWRNRAAMRSATLR
jgi:hypothetical protein